MNGSTKTAPLTEQTPDTSVEARIRAVIARRQKPTVADMGRNAAMALEILRAAPDGEALSGKEIAELMRVHTSTIYSSLHRLEKAGYIRVVRTARVGSVHNVKFWGVQPEPTS